MSDSTWWPDGYTDPAFQVQRDIYSAMLGGDYVRGSAQFKGTLSGAATALPTGPVDGDMWLLGTPVPTAAPNPPTGTKAAGNIIRWNGTAWLPNNVWVNLGPITQTVGTALRYPTSTEDFSTIAGRTILHVRPVNHSTVQIEWGWPTAPNDGWSEMSLVRSAFGRPSTVNDGQTIYRRLRTDFIDASGQIGTPPVLQDGSLPAGRWYHYALFFKMSPTEWVRGMSDSCLLPRDLQHADHLWNNVPPYYRWVDSQTAQQTGYLQQFLTIFGFELDQAREFIESWQHLYDIDWAPMRLLQHLGPNFGIDYEAGLGDIRFRSLMSNIGYLYEVRGTQPGLELLVSNMSKYQCTVSTGTSLMLTPNDSDFFQGTGNWAGLHQDTLAEVIPPPSWVRLDGSAGTWIDGPDLSALAGASTITVECDCSTSVWHPGVFSFSLASQLDTANTAAGSWEFSLNGAGATTAAVSTGASFTQYTGTVNAYAADSRHIIGGTWTAVSGANSNVQFKADGANVGAPVTGATFPAGLRDSALPLRIGANSGGSNRFNGNIYAVRIYAGGTLIASPDFTAMTSRMRSITDAQGNVWTLKGSAMATSTATPVLLPPARVFLAQTNVGEAPPSKGRGSMRVWTSAADVAAQFAITVGDGMRFPNNDANTATAVEILPSDYGIPVTPGASYGFAVSVMVTTAPFQPEPFLMFFDKDGYPSEPLSVARSLTPSGFSDTNWHDVFWEGQAPATATFVVPGVLFSVRPALVGGVAPNIYICGAMVYVAGDVGTVLALPPDRYLTMGDPSELIGSRTPTFDPFLLGAPRSR